MATSTNYLWTEPNDSDLVKNGASAIRTLGNAIDASLWSSGYGQAGKNKIINGDFKINQRAFTSSTASGYGFDRWATLQSDGTVTYSAQTFTAGTAPVAGYEAANYARLVTTGQTLTSAVARWYQAIEDVRTFAGQTVTVSFWAKAATGTPKMAFELNQSFGTGGSPSATVNNYVGQVTLSTSWARYSLTYTVPSISGKTVGTTTPGALFLQMWVSAGSDSNARTGSLGIQSNTFDLWGVQVEAGSTATPFQTATGTIQGELAACQRYYYRNGADTVYQTFGNGSGASTTIGTYYIQHPVPMRVAPTSIDYSTLSNFDTVTVAATAASVVINSNQNGKNGTYVQVTNSSAVLTQYRPYFLIANNSSSAYLGFGAEL